MNRDHVAKTSMLMAAIIALLLALSGCGVSDGGFLTAEYQIKFLTSDGRPAVGVQLEVQDNSGRISYGYPVTDYYASHIPTSDANGIMIFHHVMYFMEYGGAFFFGCSTVKIPEFGLRFISNGELVYDIKYIDLNRMVNLNSTAITRTVSVYDEGSARAAWKHDEPNYPFQVVEATFDFHVFEQTITVTTH
jgi:hypothetical protein